MIIDKVIKIDTFSNKIDYCIIIDNIQTVTIQLETLSSSEQHDFCFPFSQVYKETLCVVTIAMICVILALL